MKVPADQLRGLLGITEVHSVHGNHAIAVVDESLSDAAKPAAASGSNY
jgi:hypothetical protein